jgi:plasmanylethanolamine desaturase
MRSITRLITTKRQHKREFDSRLNPKALFLRTLFCMRREEPPRLDNLKSSPSPNSSWPVETGPLSLLSLVTPNVSQAANGPLVPAGSGYSGIEEKSGPLHSFVEHIMTYAFPALWIVSLYLAIRELSNLGLLWTIIVAAPVAWVLADFASGLVHWFADTYGTDETPLFGPWLIRPFRQHHSYPRDICTHGLVLTIGNSCTLAVPFQAGLLYLMASDEEVSGTQAFLSLGFNFFAAAVVATNVLHKWAHAERTNRVIAFLQRLRLVLTTNHHDLHHTQPFDSNYCITNGWLNPLLERIKFFRRLEQILGKAGIKPAASCHKEGAILARSSTAQ